MVKIGDLLAQITGEPSPTTAIFPPLKRKAEDDLRKPVEMVYKPNTQPANSSRPVNNSRSSSGLDLKGKLAPNKSAFSGTTFKNGQPTPPPSNNDVPKPPKKGSYAEIMARGQAAQKLMGQVGKIQHKKIEKLPTQREREKAKLQKAGRIQKGLDPRSKFQKPGQLPVRDGRNGMKENGNVKQEAVPEKKIKKAALATTGYSGTARPKTAGPSRSSVASSTMRRTDPYADRRGASSRYTYVSEEEEDEEEEQDYESDLSDMEAAAFEVDEEEEQAARIARKEDAEALAEENRLKREKEEKRRKLMAMAKKAKPQSY